MKSRQKKRFEPPMRTEYDLSGGIAGKHAGRDASETHWALIRSAGKQIDAMIAAAGTTEDRLLRDFEELRRSESV
jgi:hypothetical protein